MKGEQETNVVEVGLYIGIRRCLNPVKKAGN